MHVAVAGGAEPIFDLISRMPYSLETLEFHRLLELVARNAQTPMGRERILALSPLTSRLELESSLDGNK